MCGGAIISDFIPAGSAAAAGRSRPVTADILWPNLRKPRYAGGKRRGGAAEAVVDDFEADFREFKDDSDIDEDEDDDDDLLVGGVKDFGSFTSNTKPQLKTRGM